MKHYFFIKSLVLLAFAGFTQTSPKLHLHLLEYPGLSVEQAFNQNWSVETMVAFKSKKYNQMLASSEKTKHEKDIVVNFLPRYYPSSKTSNMMYFLGPFFRYRYTHIGWVDPYNLTEEQQTYVEHTKEFITEKKLRYAIGVQSGIKIIPKERLSIDMVAGFGISPQAWNSTEVKCFNGHAYTYPTGIDDFLTGLNRLSIMLSLGIGYRFFTK